MLKFTTLSMLDIINTLENKLQTLDAKEILEFQVINPDFVTSTYSGN
ncbi:MAG: hypothetical protein ACI9TV_003121, partial [Sulfurimonas sp.]